MTQGSIRCVWQGSCARTGSWGGPLTHIRSSAARKLPESKASGGEAKLPISCANTIGEAKLPNVRTVPKAASAHSRISGSGHTCENGLRRPLGELVGVVLQLGCKHRATLHRNSIGRLTQPVVGATPVVYFACTRTPVGRLSSISGIASQPVGLAHGRKVVATCASSFCLQSTPEIFESNSLSALIVSSWTESSLPLAAPEAERTNTAEGRGDR